MRTGPGTGRRRRGSRLGVLAGIVLLSVAATAPPAVAADGPPPDRITRPDPSDATVGFETSLALDAAGNPVIAYYDLTNDTLRLLHCTNPDCAGPQAPRAPDPTPFVGEFPSLVLDADGNPVVSYHDSTRSVLRVLHCTNPDCSGPQTSQVVDTVGSYAGHSSLVLDALGNPVVAYYDARNGRLRLLHCTNPDCSGPQQPQSPDPELVVGAYPSLRLDADGNPVISYYALLQRDLRLLHCTNPDCSGPQQPQSPDTDSLTGRYTSLALDAAGNPVVAYYFIRSLETEYDLRLLHCTNPDCSGPQHPQAPDTAGDVGLDASLVLDAEGNPVVSYADGTNSDLKVLHCTNPDCSGPQQPRAPDTAGAVGYGSSLALDADGNPVVSYFDITNFTLGVLHCGTPTCATAR